MIRLLHTAVILQLLWLAGANIFLAQQTTQDWVSEIRPDRVTVSWDSAWSWYPGQVTVSGAEVSGQTPRFQFQADVQRVSGRIAFLPLLNRQVVINGVRVSNGEYRQRSRLKADGSNQEVSQWFPPIRGYELTPTGQRPKPRREPWTIIFNDAELSGSFRTWIHRFQAELDVKARVNVDTRTQGGPVHVQVNDLDAGLKRVWADEGTTLVNGGGISGDLSVGPYRYREHPGPRAFRFLDANLDLDFGSDNLSFVKLFLLRYPSMNISGTSNANGKLLVSDGRVSMGTKIDIEADNLLVSQPPYEVSGKGSISLEGTDSGPLPFLISMRIQEIDLHHTDDGALLISGNSFHVNLHDDGDLVPHHLHDPPLPHDFTANVDIPDARVEEVTAFNELLPDDAPMRFIAGQAGFTANLTFTPDTANGDVNISGDQLTAHIDGQDVGIDVRFDGVLEGGRPLEREFDVSGSVFDFSRARIVGEKSDFDDENWSASITVTEGTVNLAQEPDVEIAADLAVSDSRPISALFINNGGPKWIGRRLSADDLNGDMHLRMKDRSLYVSEAQLGAEDLEFAAKGLIANPDKSGMVYIRYKRLDALLDLTGEKRNIVLIGSLRKFDAYSVTMPPSP